MTQRNITQKLVSPAKRAGENEKVREPSGKVADAVAKIEASLKEGEDTPRRSARIRAGKIKVDKRACTGCS